MSVAPAVVLGANDVTPPPTAARQSALSLRSAKTEVQSVARARTPGAAAVRPGALGRTVAELVPSTDRITFERALLARSGERIGRRDRERRNGAHRAVDRQRARRDVEAERGSARGLTDERALTRANETRERPKQGVVQDSLGHARRCAVAAHAEKSTAPCRSTSPSKGHRHRRSASSPGSAHRAESSAGWRRSSTRARSSPCRRRRSPWGRSRRRCSIVRPSRSTPSRSRSRTGTRRRWLSAHGPRSSGTRRACTKRQRARAGRALRSWRCPARKRRRRRVDDGAVPASMGVTTRTTPRRSPEAARWSRRLDRCRRTPRTRRETRRVVDAAPNDVSACEGSRGASAGGSR